MNLLVEIAQSWLAGWLYGAALLLLALGIHRLGWLRSLWQQEQSWRWLLFAPSLIMLLHMFSLPQRAAEGFNAAGQQAMAWATAATSKTEGLPPDVAASRRASLTLVAHPAKSVVEVEPTLVPANGSSAATAPAQTAALPAARRSVSAQSVPARVHSWQLGLAPTLAATLAALLISAVLIRVGRVCRAWVRQWRQIRHQPRWPQGPLTQELQRLSQDAGVAVPTLRRAPDDSTPHAWSPATISLPAWLPTVMNPQQQRATLAHELAHLRRADPRWRLAYALQLALFPLPFAQRVREQLDQLAELACDDWAARQAGSRRAMAESLARCAQHIVSPAAGFASAMTTRRSPVVARVQHLLKEPVMNPNATRWPLRLLLPTAVVATALFLPGLVVSEQAVAATSAPAAKAQQRHMPEPPEPPQAPEAPEPPPPPPSVSNDDMVAPPAPPAVPAPPAPPVPPAPPAKSSISQYNWLLGERTVIEIERKGYALSATIKGDFELNDAETDFAKIDDSVDIEETRDGVKRQLRLTKSSSGLDREYRVDGNVTNFDAAAQAWWAGLIKQFAREGLVSAKSRVERILAQGGAAAVIDEIGQIHAAHARASHLVALYKQAQLNRQQLTASLNLAQGIKSDYELRRVLQMAAEHQTMDRASVLQACEQAKQIDSDYEARVFLQALAKHLPADKESISAWRSVYDSIGSDYEARVAVQALIENDAMQGAMLEQVVSATESIGSDYERRVALQSLAPRIQQQPSLIGLYAKSVAGIGSDYEARVAVTALMDDATLSGPALLALVDAVDSIDSDYERRIALQAIAEHSASDSALIERIRRSAKPLGSHERGVLEKALDKLSG